MKLLFNLILVATLILAVPLSSQDLDSPLRPVKEHANFSIGAIIGFGQNFQSGEYFVECDGCEFSNGLQFGWEVGISLNYRIIDKLFFTNYLLYRNMGIESDFIEYYPYSFYSNVTQNNEQIPINLHHRSTAKFDFLSVIPTLQFAPLDWLWINAGLSISYVMNAKITHNLELMENRVIFEKTGEVFDINIDDSRNTNFLVEDGDFPEVNSIQLGFQPAIGFPIAISRDHRLTPIFSYYIPLNNISEYGNDFKLNNWRILIEYRLFFKSY